VVPWQPFPTMVLERQLAPWLCTAGFLLSELHSVEQNFLAPCGPASPVISIQGLSVFQFTRRGLFMALFISLSAGNAQAEPHWGDR
jgi:hypothetical protein